MAVVEVVGQDEGFTRQQRWSHALTLLVGALALLYGLNMRATTLNATEVYTNVQAGIRVSYPRTWLLDEGGDHVFRIRDMSRVGFKTTISISIQPVGTGMTASNVLDGLNIARPQTLATYGILSEEVDYTLPDDSGATALNYTYVEVENNPFVESVPVVVLGRDILTIKGGQAIIITFRADSLTFDQDIAIFNRFLESLEFE
jgi:hypothetical protein